MGKKRVQFTDLTLHDGSQSVWVMKMTPASQFFASQAAVNVATGERYKVVLDRMIETALGVWG